MTHNNTTLSPDKFYMSLFFIFRGDGQIFFHSLDYTKKLADRKWIRFRAEYEPHPQDVLQEIDIDAFIADHFEDLF